MKTHLYAAAIFMSISTVATGAVPFNQSGYEYMQLWQGDTPTQARWPDYSAAAGKIIWRDGNMTGYVADFNALSGAISNIVTYTGANSSYDQAFSPTGDYVFYQDSTSTTSLTVSGGTVEAYKIYRYDIANGSTDTVFDISTMDVATIEAATSYVGSELGFYIAAGQSDDHLLMSIKNGEDSNNMDVFEYQISTESFTTLTSSTNPQAEYDGQYLNGDPSKLLYWTERKPTSAHRTLKILAGATEEIVDSLTSPDMYLGVRWGSSHDEVYGTFGTGWANTDLRRFIKEGSTWTSEDVTGSAWDVASGGIYPGASTGGGVLFGVRNSNADDDHMGLWYAFAVPEPATLGLFALGFLAFLRRPRRFRSRGPRS